MTTPKIRPDAILLVVESADTEAILDLPCGCRYRYRVIPELGCVKPLRVREALHVIAADAADGVLVEGATSRARIFLQESEMAPVAECLKARITHGGPDV